ncbi:MAG TPA: class I SAM-dependent methyltransferase [Thermoanaerobaculia bacterium]|nr:class I SAM-dependent methyltransferase [Thermoanaerobaculia bacterium]
MSMGTVRALRVLHRAFRHYAPGHRIHILIRFLTCPFIRTIDDVPAGARVLDVGSGHALYGVLLLDGRASEVVAVDPDLRKSLLPTPSPGIRKIAGYDDAVRGTFDAVVIFDVAYRMPPAERRALFTRILARLEPGGTFLFKDMDPRHRLKMKWARFQEWLSDRLLGITLGAGFVEQTREDVMAMLEEIGFRDVQARAIDRGYVHPHLLYTAKRK